MIKKFKIGQLVRSVQQPDELSPLAGHTLYVEPPSPTVIFANHERTGGGVFRFTDVGIVIHIQGRDQRAVLVLCPHGTGWTMSANLIPVD